MLNKINNRIILIMTLCSIMLLYCIYGMVDLAFFQKGKFNGDKSIYRYYTQEQFDTLDAQSRRNCVVEDHINPTRGIIYDDMNRPLVSSVRVYPIGVDGRSFDPKHIYFTANSPYLDTLVNDISRMFYAQFHDRYPNYTLEKYREKFTRVFKKRERVQIFSEDDVQKYSKMVVERDLNAIKQMPVFSRTIEPKDRGRYGLANKEKVYFQNILDKGGQKLTIRLRPYGEMGSRILGDVAKKNGIDGCKMFSPILAGKPGIRRQLYVNGISIPLSMENPPVEGGDVYTTLNIEIQKIVHQALMDKAKQAHPLWACAIVMETATGDIKGISNFHAIPPAAPGQDTIYIEARNYAMVSEVAEPGSTFKLASLLAYLEKTGGDTTHTFEIFNHTFKSRGRSYLKHDSGNPKATVRATPREIIQRSSNVGIAQMIDSAFNHNYAEYVEMLNSMYITVGFNAQIDKIPAIVNLRPETKIFEEQYSRYFGAAFSMQPLQTLVYYNAVANGGKMMQPRFVKAVSVEGKRTDFQPEVIKEQIASPKTIAITQDILKSVVDRRPGTAYSTARRVAPGVSFAGKTGTRDIFDTKLGKYDKDRNAVSFCGYFPADKPKYTCIVYLFNVAGGSSEAIEVFANIAKRIMNPPAKIPNNEKHAQFSQPVSKNTYTALARYYKFAEKDTTKSAKFVISSSQGTPTRYNVPNYEDIPDVTGLSAIDAVAALRKTDYQVRLKGCGTVSKIDIDKQNKIIVLTLSTG